MTNRTMTIGSRTYKEVGDAWSLGAAIAADERCFAEVEWTGVGQLLQAALTSCATDHGSESKNVKDQVLAKCARCNMALSPLALGMLMMGPAISGTSSSMANMLRGGECQHCGSDMSHLIHDPDGLAFAQRPSETRPDGTGAEKETEPADEEEKMARRLRDLLATPSTGIGYRGRVRQLHGITLPPAVLEEIRDIGESLYAEEGMEATLNMANKVRALGGSTRMLEACWEGIGDWMY